MTSTKPFQTQPPGEPARTGDEEFPEDPRFRTMRRLVNALLMVLIAGVLTIVIALLLTLKDFRTPIAPLAPGERLISAVATEARVTLTLEAEGGARRVIVLDGENFQPLSEIVEAPSD